MTGVLNHARNGCNQSGQTETTAASCSHGGVRTRKCTTCGKTETQNTPANGVHHQGSWSSWSKLNETQHQKTRSCSECHKTETQTSNHSQGSQSNWQDHNETQHKRSHTCSTCNYTAWKYANHTYGDWIIDKATTCSAKGSKHKICSQCGHRVDAEIEIDQSAHDYQQKDYDIDSTCTNLSMLPLVKSKIKENSILNYGSWAYLGLPENASNRYLFWSSIDRSKEGTNKTIPIIVCRANGGYQIRTTITANIINKGETYITLADHIADYSQYTKGQRYEILQEDQL